MAVAENERLQLPHVNLPDLSKSHLSEGRRQCLIDNHNLILDGITISPWLVEELATRSLLTSRQRRTVEVSILWRYCPLSLFRSLISLTDHT